MKIDQAATVTGVTARRIRCCEQIGLIEPAGRTDSGHRHFGKRDLSFIQRAPRLGFSQRSNLVALRRDQNRSSADVKRIANEHIAELEQQIAGPQSRVDTLEHPRKCSGDARSGSPIIAGFEGDAS